MAAYMLHEIEDGFAIVSAAPPNIENVVELRTLALCTRRYDADKIIHALTRFDDENQSRLEAT